MNVRLQWDKTSISRRRMRFKAAQNYVDSECLRLMLYYVPVGLRRFRNSGALRDSGRVSSPGVIIFTDPWARSNYYNLQKRNYRHGGNPNAPALWFETMKARHGKAILRGAAAIAGGKN